MNKPTLLILAAGMGSRYGGLKQLDPVGPSGEIVLDYSIYDALRAGFGRVVFVIHGVSGCSRFYSGPASNRGGCGPIRLEIRPG